MGVKSCKVVAYCCAFAYDQLQRGTGLCLDAQSCLRVSWACRVQNSAPELATPNVAIERYFKSPRKGSPVISPRLFYREGLKLWTPRANGVLGRV